MNFSEESYKNVMFKLKSSPFPENIPVIPREMTYQANTSDLEVTTVNLLLLLFEK